MKIAIIGAGNVGGTLGLAWAAKGHDIVFGVRHPGDEKIKTLVQAMGACGSRGGRCSKATSR